MKKDFEEIYTEVYDECINNLKEVRNKLGKFVSGILLVLVVINVIVGIVAEYKSLLTISISLSVLVLLVFLKNAHKIYSQKYKEFVNLINLHSLAFHIFNYFHINSNKLVIKF